MAKGIKLPELSKAELTPAVVELLEMVQDLAERVQLREEEIGRLRDEIAVLKRQKKRPKIKPSKMDDDTGGALMGSLLAHGLPPEMAIVSDDAGQFNVFRHGLCWIHAERVMVRIIPLNEAHRKEQQWVREQIWDLYADLNVYKAAPQATESTGEPKTLPAV